MTWQIAMAFFLSGFAGLMHEVVWSKLLATLIGTTAHAQAAVLVVYMGGLALGSVIYGWRSDRVGHSLRTYMILEVAIALYCLALPLFLAVASEGYVRLASYVFESSQLKFALRFAMALATIILPAVLMGGTLPLLARHVIDRPSQARTHVAALYTLNSFGAVAGAAAGGFITLPALGVYASLVAASVMNAIAALVVWPQVARDRGADVARAPGGRGARGGPTRTYEASTYRVALLALLLSGFAAMAYEVVFIRVISLGFGATTFSFTVMLMSFITGIGLGSLVVMRLRIDRPLWLLGVCQLVAAVAFLAATPLMERLPYYVALVRIAAGDSFAFYLVGKAALCLAVLLVPTMCLGASFPLVTAIQARQPDRIGSLVGTTYACNTLGNVLGILATTLILLPTVGLLGSFHVAIAFSLGAGVMVLAVAAEVPLQRRVLAVGVAALALAVYAASGMAWTVPLQFASNHLRLRDGVPPDLDAAAAALYPSSSFDAWKRRFVLDEASILQLEEESHANVVVTDAGGAVSLIVNTKTDASTAPSDMETQTLVAHLPLFMHPRARSLLVVGYGSGITIGSAMRHPIERADVVEISRGVLDVDPAYAPHNYRVLQDPRVHIYIDDAQSFLRTTPHRYDAIICQPSNPWISGIAGLFTAEFFEVSRAKLDPGGVFTLWFQEYEQSDEAIRLILRTFRSVFPHVTLFNESNYDDIIAVGSADPLRIDFAAMEDRFDRPEVRNDLARIGISNMASLLSHHAVAPERVATLIGDGPINSSLRQQLEYLSIRAMFVGDGTDLIERHNPLLTGEGTILLDDYSDFRRAVGDPLSRHEIEVAAAHMSARSSYAEEHKSALMKRAELAPVEATAPTRVSRGAPPPARTAGLFDAQFWARRFKDAGDSRAAQSYVLRATRLRESSQTLPEAGAGE